MNFSEAEAEIRKFFDTTWSNATEIAYPDLEFTPPDDKTWVRFDVRENAGNQVSIGSPSANRFRHFGIVTVQIFQPLGQGSKDARAKTVLAINAFQGQTTANGAVFSEVTGRQIGNDGNGFYQINVLASFYYDEIT